MLLRHEITYVFQCLMSSLRKSVNVCTGLIILFQSKDDNQLKMRCHASKFRLNAQAQD